VLCVAAYGIVEVIDYIDNGAAQKTSTSAPSATVKKGTGVEHVKPVAQTMASPTMPDLTNSATVRDITALSSTLELRKVQVQLVELEKKIADARAAAAPKPEAPVIVSMPQSASPVPAGRGPSAAASAQAAAAAGVSEKLPRVISIEGMDGRLQAALSTSDGIRRVKVGDTVSQGRIERIDVGAVVLSTDGESKTLSFME
jgi:type IV pilus biogenesis protein PilP